MSRLLWPAYLFLMAWIVLPVYATIVAGLLPLGDADVDRFLSLVIASVGLLAWWSGIRGGPLMMSSAEILLGLSGESKFPARYAVVRQAVLVGGFFGLATAWLTAMALGGHPDWVISALRTLVGAEVGILIVSLAVLWNVDGHRWLDRGFALAITGIITYTAISAPTPESTAGLLALIAIAVLVMAAYRAHDLRVDRLWSRSLVLTELRFSAALADYRTALASLRSSRDGPRRPRGKPGPGRLPVWLWRPLRSLQGSPFLVLGRYLAMIGLVAALLTILEDTAARLAAIAGVLAVGAVDLTAPLAEVVRRPLLHRSSRIPARFTLVAESAVGILLTLIAGLAGFAIVAGEPGQLGAPEVIAIALAAGASSTIQARLGSPDLGAMIDRYGPDRIQGTLATRSATPVLALFLTVSGVNALTKNWNPNLAFILVIGWAIALVLMTRPEEAD